MNKGAKIGIAVVCTALVGVAGVGAYNVYDSLSGSDEKSPKVRTVVAEAPSADLAAAGAKAFLEAWAKGDLEAAGALTDKPDTATATLRAFQDKVKPSALTLTPGGTPTAPASPSAKASASASASASAAASPSASAPTGTEVPLSFRAKVEFAGTANAWNYEGRLGLVKMSDGKAAVHWAPNVVHPKLDSGESIAVKPVFAEPAMVLDRNGKPLNFPSLTPALMDRFKQNASGDPADAGTGVVIAKDDGTGTADKLFTITDPKPAASLKLTLDGKLQAEAEKAVAAASKGGTLQASLVAIEPSTGHVLAFANAPTTGQNRAFLGAVAPGSTMKVITAAALLEAGVKPDDPVPCPAGLNIAGQAFKNDFTEPHEDWKFSQDFAQSCNTAMIKKGMEVLKSGDMEALAKDAFGIGPTWKTGMLLAPAKAPAPSGENQRAAQLIGQGSITMNALTMASVSATVQSGTFRQPILVPGAEQQKAEKTLAAGTLQSLRAMMNLTATSGTAAGVMNGITAGAGAKTGTAQVNNQANDNSWFTAYRGNLAVAAEVGAGGHGADAAGPAAAMVLKLGNG
ncbi:penicillin-binding transpeptidase domain-containing protein [Kitasatospora sp. NPDC002040]|uniref:penicillin-binding transpeptidase domain-containing protein n=1 Tax=Kitasatospora sp. NPDC002040 TaxID=3154661 RepID=UPI00331B0A98